jgi:hypothetical protein
VQESLAGEQEMFNRGKTCARSMCRGTVTVQERLDMGQRHMQECKEQGQYMYRGDRPHARRQCYRRENLKNMETSIQKR